MIKYFVLDVDGTMTDGGIYYDEKGNELKKFCTRDAAGIFAAHNIGMKILVITGRKCEATTKRMSELKVDYLYQNIKDKKRFLQEFMIKNDIKKEEIGYIGDDLNDLPSMFLVGYIGCPADACFEVRTIADYVSCNNGGTGVVRDVIEHYLRKHNKWETAINNVYDIGV